jgi:ribosomal protein S18 acetylase RimI-like enzyme
MAVVRAGRVEERERTLVTIVDAFATDPVVRWFFPDYATYPERAATLFGYLFDVRLPVGGVWVTEGGEAAALWTPPGDLPEWADAGWDEAVSHLQPDEAERLARWDAAVARHHPAGDHWYLGVLATAPEHQGNGHGPNVAGPGLKAANEAGLPAFLETGVESNVRLYERLGFVVTGTIDDPGLPHGWCMQTVPTA